jgi:hypothetical protein
MKVNTKSIKDLIGEDHITFSAVNGGFHKKSRYVDTVGVPTGLQAGIGTVYTKLAQSTGASNESDLFYIPDTGDPAPGPTRDYQLTRTITGSFPLFSKSTQNYNSVGAAYFGGWTFLPGGMLLQYGLLNSTLTAAILFPVPFTNIPFSIQITPVTVTGGFSAILTVASGSVSTTGFNINTAGSLAGGLRGVYWMAIGV